MDECIDKNMIDKGEYPQSAEIENRCDENTPGVVPTPGATFALNFSRPGGQIVIQKNLDITINRGEV